MLRTAATLLLIVIGMHAAPGQNSAETPPKSRSVLYPADMVEKALANAARYPWAADMQDSIAAKAAPWMRLSDDDLWRLIFGPHITRSWMVWSNGFCPQCKQDVRMYTWRIDAWAHPWKVRCPHCGTLFPTNDFEAFHSSGLDERGIFIPERADRSLLYNAQHPDPDDPLRSFGVDDGEGYVDAEGRRWRFIGAYLIYGQWKQLIVSGIDSLSRAYLVTGDTEYARKAAVLLDRVADVFPTYIFEKQGLVYEYGPHRGQVSTWHDACGEMHTMIKAYDRIFEAARSREKDLVGFLARKAKEYGLENPKESWADIQRNIEGRIFRETLAHRSRIESNYPTTDQTILFINVVLGWPHNRQEVLGHLDSVIGKSTAVDGLSGEKGLAGYTIIAPRSLASILASLGRLEPGFLEDICRRHPVLHDTYRFHIDTWCLDGRYYPQVGDSGRFAARDEHYKSVALTTNPATEPSMYAFLWDLYTATGDPAFVQVLYRENGSSADGLPYDLFADDPAGFQEDVGRVIAEVGTDIPLASVNKEEWRIAILRGGDGENRRALWIDYDSGERHSHADGMNIGLFAKGLDLIPEFGYPAVGYGGWGSPIGKWYTRTAAHCTVVVDGKDQERLNSGVTTLWADGQRFRAIRVSDPAIIGGSRYERTVAMVDIDERDFYVVDSFLVEGGRDHARFFHSAFGAVETAGLELRETEDFGHETQMRNFRVDDDPEPGWSADWRIQDRYGYLPEGSEIHLRHTDLTRDAAAYVAEAWIDPTLFGGSAPEYIPCIMTRRMADEAPLFSSFAAVLETYEGERPLAAISRLVLVGADGAALPDACVGVEVRRGDGRRDLVVMAPGPETEVSDAAGDIHVRAALAYASIAPEGVERACLCRGTYLEAGTTTVTLSAPAEFVELVFEKDGYRLVSGERKAIESVSRGGQPLGLIE